MMPDTLPEYVCVRRDVDDVPDAGDAVWNGLAGMQLRETDTGAQPRLATRVDAFWSAHALYFRFVGADDHVVATMTAHDDPIYQEDVVEVFLSENGALETYKELELSPTNVKFDALIDNDLRGNVTIHTEWHAEGWTSTSRVAGGRWISVWALPFTSFGQTPALGDRWRMNCYRIDRGDGRPDQFMAWSPTGVRKFHVPARFGYLVFGA